MELNTIYNTDCLAGLKELPDNFCHSIITDPPYELNFMGKKWDRTKISYSPELWGECLRVHRPGGYLLSFAATRTYHRIACAIEDAGFEIRDLIDSFYDNGQDVINFLDSLSPEQAGAFVRLLENRIAVGFLSWVYGQGLPKSQDVAKAIDKTLGAYKKSSKVPYEPVTPEAKRWSGWGTSLKPANEPIIMARKPLSEKTIAENVLKWGTGGINIDGSRIRRRENDSYMTFPARPPAVHGGI